MSVTLVKLPLRRLLRALLQTQDAGFEATAEMRLTRVSIANAIALDNREQLLRTEARRLLTLGHTAAALVLIARADRLDEQQRRLTEQAAAHHVAATRFARTTNGLVEQIRLMVVELAGQRPIRRIVQVARQLALLPMAAGGER